MMILFYIINFGIIWYALYIPSICTLLVENIGFLDPINTMVVEYALLYMFVGIITYLYNRYLIKNNKKHKFRHGLVWSVLNCVVYFFIHCTIMPWPLVVEGVLPKALMWLTLEGGLVIINVLVTLAAYWYSKINTRIQKVYFFIAFFLGLLLISSAAAALFFMCFAAFG